MTAHSYFGILCQQLYYCHKFSANIPLFYFIEKENRAFFEARALILSFVKLHVVVAKFLSIFIGKFGYYLRAGTR